jgi:hypothetical protein
LGYRAPGPVRMSLTRRRPPLNESAVANPLTPISQVRRCRALPGLQRFLTAMSCRWAEPTIDLLGVNELHGGRCWSLAQVESLLWSHEVGAGWIGCCTHLLYSADWPLPVSRDSRSSQGQESMSAALRLPVCAVPYCRLSANRRADAQLPE